MQSRRFSRTVVTASVDETTEKVFGLVNDMGFRLRVATTWWRKMPKKIFWALGEIDDPQAIQVLVPFLGEKEADKALRKLGQGDFVDAFHGVLDLRDVNAVEKLQERAYRREVAAAFIRVLNLPLFAGLPSFRMLKAMEESSSKGDRDSKLLRIWQQTFKHALNSVWALAQLRAIEVLPLLERIGRRQLASLPKTLGETTQLLPSASEPSKSSRPLQPCPVPLLSSLQTFQLLCS